MIEIPTNCPVCDSLLERVNDQLFCRNDLCMAKGYKRVEHFAKALKIKGLGPASINKLDITDPADLYKLTESKIQEIIKSAVIAEKLVGELVNSTARPLEDVLPAMGIPLVGQSATNKLQKVCNSIEDINEHTCKLAGLGDKTTNNLLSWIRTEEYKNYPFDFKFTKSNTEIKDGDIIVITGKLTSFKTKSDATKILTELGFTVKDSITKNTKYLVNEGGKDSTKTVKAREAGILIIENLNEFIGEYKLNDK